MQYKVLKFNMKLTFYKNVQLLLAGNQTFINELNLPKKRFNSLNSVQSLLSYL